MSDNNPGSGAEPAPQASDVLGGPGNTSPATPSADPASQPAADPAPVQDHWTKTAGIEGEDLGWLQNRGVDKKDLNGAFAEVLKTARNAEKRLGAPADELLRLPKDMSDSEAMASVYDRLGRPATAEDYNLEAGEDQASIDFTNHFAAKAHEYGLTAKQAEAMYEDLDNYFTEFHEAQEETSTTEAAAAYEGLKSEWGETFDYNIALAKEAAAATGANQEEIDALQSALGSSAEVLKFFNRLAQGRAESIFKGGDLPLAASGTTTPEGAKARIEELKADPAWAKKLLNNDADVTRQYKSLVRLAASGGN